MEQLKPYRQRIDAIDDEIIDLLARRMEIIREVAQVKAANDIPAVLPDRVDVVRNRCVARGEALGLGPMLVYEIYTALIGHACELEEILIANTKKS